MLCIIKSSDKLVNVVCGEFIIILNNVIIQYRASDVFCPITPHSNRVRMYQKNFRILSRGSQQKKGLVT